jgi:hypothetical protein
MHSFEKPTPQAEIREGDTHDFEVVGLDADMERDVAAIRAEIPDVDATLKILDNIKNRPGVRAKLIEYLEELKPDFNWDLYFELRSNENTLH